MALGRQKLRGNRAGFSHGGPMAAARGDGATSTAREALGAPACGKVLFDQGWRSPVDS